MSAPKYTVRVVKAADGPQPGLQPIKKAEAQTQLDDKQARAAGEFVNPPYEMVGLKQMVNNSNILPQCIAAYRNNIVGFGIGLRYISGDTKKETTEMKKEWDAAQEVIDLLSIDHDTKEVFEAIIEARETYGIAYAEIMRNPEGQVNQISFIRDTPSVKKTYPLDPPVEVEYNYKGQKIIKRPRRFCKYRQDVGSKTVFFKEFGDPRIMDNRSGEYVTTDSDTGDALEVQYQANEILDFPIGTELYGEIRWMGQVLGIDGARKAENLNNNYFRNGRHTPLMICVNGGTLTDESYTKLTEYMNGIKGESGQHAFLILEVEDADNRAGFDQDQKPQIEVKDLASILQKDELFQEYIENTRKRVQSSFRLPDLYTGYTSEYNRATSQAAMEVTEEQVFQPERKSLAWIINNRLLNGYGFKYVEAYFLEPDISNPDDLYKILTVAERAGGLTPNKARAIVGDALGEEAENYDGEWGDLPVAARELYAPSTPVTPEILSQLNAQITKAAANNDDAVVAVMKEVKAVLMKMVDGGDADAV